MPTSWRRAPAATTTSASRLPIPWSLTIAGSMPARTSSRRSRSAMLSTICTWTQEWSDIPRRSEEICAMCHHARRSRGYSPPVPGLLSIQRHGEVALVTLERPEKRNALSIELRLEVADAFGHLSRDQEVGCIVLTGAGTAFCSGMDTSQFGGD